MEAVGTSKTRSRILSMMIPSLSCYEGVDNGWKRTTSTAESTIYIESSDLIFHFPPQAVPTRSAISRTFLSTTPKLQSTDFTKMALRDEQADILGGPIFQRPEAGVFAIFFRYHFVLKSVTLLGLGLLVWIASTRGLEHLKKHRELRGRKYVSHPDAFISL